MTPRTRFVAVALPLPVDHTFTYEAPPGSDTSRLIGARVLVPFGRKKLTGVVIDSEAEPDDGLRIRPIIEVLDEEPSLTAELLKLTRWISTYYLCGWGEAIRAALPPGTDVRTRTFVHRLELPDLVPPRFESIASALRDRGEVSLHMLKTKVESLDFADLQSMEKEGWILLESRIGDARIAPRIEQHLRFAPPYRDPDLVVDMVDTLRGEKQQRLLRTLLGHLRMGRTEVLRADVLRESDAPPSTVQSLARHGIIEVVDREVFRSPITTTVPPVTAPEIELHAAQRIAVDRIIEVVQQGDAATFLLHGITGSGKTEVYIEALRRVRAMGKTGIVLVPEIALTPQTVRRFRSHFGDGIAVLHSRMSLGERYDTWRRIRAGEFDVVIGPRSAVLAPLENIGLIVVDEEHESSYKQFEPDPRYHARDVAVVRAKMNGAVCILGSATPALESFMNARGGKYELLRMPDRIPRRDGLAVALPDVQIVDLTLERRRRRLVGSISADLYSAIDERLRLGEQVILLQNRRGYSPVVECQACGWSPECVDCSVTLTYHKAKHQMRCHYCGRAWRHPKVCPECNEDALDLLGAGTQRIEEELVDLFPDAGIRRMDQDTTSHKAAHHEILQAFGDGEIDILLGTQMIAKGLDFPKVTLVGVVNADGGLLLPDFRSEERTFQLLMQVAGRSGRSERPGKVILQTRNPEHPVIRFARTHDYQGFAEAALAERANCAYPPFVRMAAVEFRGMTESVVEREARRWTDIVRGMAAEIEILGPEAAFVSRLKKLYRFHTIIKVPRRQNAPDVQALLAETSRTYGSPPRGMHITIDIDPVGLL